MHFLEFLSQHSDDFKKHLLNDGRDLIQLIFNQNLLKDIEISISIIGDDIYNENNKVIIHCVDTIDVQLRKAANPENSYIFNIYLNSYEEAYYVLNNVNIFEYLYKKYNKDSYDICFETQITSHSKMIIKKLKEILFFGKYPFHCMVSEREYEYSTGLVSAYHISMYRDVLELNDVFKLRLSSEINRFFGKQNLS